MVLGSGQSVLTCHSAHQAAKGVDGPVASYDTRATDMSSSGIEERMYMTLWPDVLRVLADATYRSSCFLRATVVRT